MISEKLKSLLLLATPAFILHGIEEYSTGFYMTDPISRYVFQSFESMNSLQATFLLFQVMIASMLIISYILLKDGRGVLFLATFLGIIFIFELHHLIRAIGVKGYYSGILSAMLIYILGFFYWKELLKNWRTNGRS